MKAEREDRLESNSGKGGFPTRHVLLILAVVVVGYLLWNAMGETPVEVEPEPLVVEEVVVAEPVLPPAEDIPEPVAVVTETEAVAPEEPPPPLPPLEESDELVRDQLSAVGVGPMLSPQEEQEDLVQRSAALVDGFSRGVVLRKLLPVDPPKAAFSALEEDGKMYMNPAGYSRYDSYSEAIDSLDTSALVSSFDTLRPLYEEAYGQLGLDPNDFDNAVIRMLDRVLATPEIDEPIALTRESVMYKYADPQLEQLTPMQKQLMRMGPDNIRRIKEKAKALREGLLNR